MRVLVTKSAFRASQSMPMKLPGRDGAVTTRRDDAVIAEPRYLRSERSTHETRGRRRHSRADAPECPVVDPFCDERAFGVEQRSEPVYRGHANPHRDGEALREGIGRHPETLPLTGVLGHPCRVLGGARS